MSKINLLPNEIKEEISFSKRNQKLLNGFILLATIALFLIGLFLWSNYYLNLKISKIKAESIAKEASIKKYGELEKTSKNFFERLVLYKKIEKDNLVWSVALNEIATRTPETVYLLKVKASDDEKIRGEIAGIAADKLDISRFVNSLKLSGKFKFIDIETVSLVKDPNDGKDKNNFVISFSIEPKKIK